VNNTVYFRYFENARILYSEKLGLHRKKNETGIEEDRIWMKYVAVSRRHNRIAAEGDGVVVMYNYHERKKTAITEEIRKRIAEQEKI
jgi:acyl-CoA thioester hydrolase